MQANQEQKPRKYKKISKTFGKSHNATKIVYGLQNYLKKRRRIILTHLLNFLDVIYSYIFSSSDVQYFKRFWYRGLGDIYYINLPGVFCAARKQ